MVGIYDDEKQKVYDKASGPLTSSNLMSAIRGANPRLSVGQAQQDAKRYRQDATFTPAYQTAARQNQTIQNQQQEASTPAPTTPAPVAPSTQTPQVGNVPSQTPSFDDWSKMSYGQMYNWMPSYSNGGLSGFSNDLRNSTDQMAFRKNIYDQLFSGQGTASPIFTPPQQAVSASQSLPIQNMLQGQVTTPAQDVAVTPSPVQQPDPMQFIQQVIEQAPKPEEKVEPVQETWTNPWAGLMDLLPQMQDSFNQEYQTMMGGTPETQDEAEPELTYEEKVNNQLKEMLGEGNWSESYMNPSTQFAIQDWALANAKDLGTSPQRVLDTVGQIVGGQLGQEHFDKLTEQREYEKQLAAQRLAKDEERRKKDIENMYAKRMDWLQRLTNLAQSQDRTNALYHQRQMEALAKEAALEKLQKEIQMKANAMRQREHSKESIDMVNEQIMQNIMRGRQINGGGAKVNTNPVSGGNWLGSNIIGKIINSFDY